jgi:hypothetical protein
MLSTNPESEEAASPAAPLQPNFRGRWWLRIALFVLHIAILLGAGVLFVPDQHAFEFGYSYGAVLFFSSIFLWFMLLVAQTRRGIFIFCGLILGQAGLVVLVGLQFQATDRVLQSFEEELTVKRAEWAKTMEPYRMDALFDMTSGRRELSYAELQELQRRAREGGTKLGELKSYMERSTADHERRLAAVDSRAARNFRLGVESSRQVSDEQMKLLQESRTESEQLVVFLIDRYGQYAQTSKGLKFKKDEDARYFSNQLNAIASSQERLASINHRVEQGMKGWDNPSTDKSPDR